MKWGFRIAWLKDDFLIFVIINDDTGVGNIGTHVPDLDVKIPFNNTLDTVYYWFNNKYRCIDDSLRGSTTTSKMIKV